MIDAIGDRTGLIVVAQSFGGFTAPLVCDRVPVDLLVLLAGMVPAPGERADEVPAVPRRPPLPGRVHAPGGAGPPWHHRRRDRRQPLVALSRPGAPADRPETYQAER